VQQRERNPHSVKASYNHSFRHGPNANSTNTTTVMAARAGAACTIRIVEMNYLSCLSCLIGQITNSM
jgi:hypothetical protein